jgi:hypothetical protein
MDIQ